MKPKITNMFQWILQALNYQQTLDPQPYRRQWNKPKKTFPPLWGCLTWVTSYSLCYISNLPLWWEQCPLSLCPQRRRKLLLPHVLKPVCCTLCPPPTNLLELSLQLQSSCISLQLRDRPPVAEPRCWARWWRDKSINKLNDLRFNK